MPARMKREEVPGVARVEHQVPFRGEFQMRFVLHAKRPRFERSQDENAFNPFGIRCNTKW